MRIKGVREKNGRGEGGIKMTHGQNKSAKYLHDHRQMTSRKAVFVGFDDAPPPYRDMSI